jgi:competence protein ComEC
VLLPGDIEGSAERDLVRTYGNQLRSKIVKVPHHGSATSSTPSFVKAVADSSGGAKAVVSVGKENQFGMPDKSVVKRWEQVSCVRSTARRGAVWIKTNGREVWEVSWR